MESRAFFAIKLLPEKSYFFSMWPDLGFEFETPAVSCYGLFEWPLTVTLWIRDLVQLYLATVVEVNLCNDHTAPKIVGLPRFNLKSLIHSV